MTKLSAHCVNGEDDNGKEVHLATVHPASPEAIALVAAAREDDPDGRSQFVWIRLSNGDLILGVYPQGETYEKLEDTSYDRYKLKQTL